MLRRPPRSTLFPYDALPISTACQLHLRHFKDGDTITIEPWRAKAFPVVKDLVVDRNALDRIRSEEHTSELQSHHHLVCRLLPEKKNSIQALAEPVTPSLAER